MIRDRSQELGTFYTRHFAERVDKHTADMEVPGPRRYLVKDLILAAYVTLLYGDGGVAKSLLALALAVAVAGGSGKWLGREVESCPVLYMDFELDSEEQAR